MSLSKKIIKYSVFIMFILLPIIDMIRRTWVKNIQIFGFSFIELIYFIIIGFSLILTIINLKDKKKELLPLIIYTAIFVIYLIFHNFNILKFDMSIFANSKINVLIETYYILRIYYMPVLLLFILIKNKDIFDLNFYKSVIKTLICIMCISIIVLNIFKLSYATYAADNSEFVKYNIFDFYKSTESPKLLSTRGWFDSSNEISAILMILFPINIYMLYKDDKKKNLMLYIIQFLAMIILGTRVSAIGAILITITAIIINLFFRITKKAKINYKLIIFGIICGAYFFISPIGIYLLHNEVPNYNIEDEHSENLRKLSDTTEIARYINEHLYDFRIDEYFVTIYPVEKDIPFWVKMALRNRNLNNDSRVMKISIIDRIQERNNNKIDKYLGMGYTINFIDLERDYVYQYYLFGLCGIIFIVPGLASLIMSAVSIYKQRKKMSLVNTLLILMSPVLGFLVAYYSGHVFGWVSPSYVLILVISLLYYYVSNYKESEI